MKITLHMAVSMDGYIAKKDGATDWVSVLDFALFEKRCRKAGCVILGRKTFDEIRKLDGVDYIALTRRKLKGEYYASSVAKAVAKARAKKHNKILLAGGGETNTAFLKAGLIGEIFLSVHPVVLGGGIRLFEGAPFTDGFRLLGVSELGEGFAQLHYKIAAA